jgi:Zn-finger nucleic acid-binding protein
MLQCPACHIPLCRIEYENVPVHICPDCRGALVDMMRFRTITVRREKTWTDDQKRQIEAETSAQVPQGDKCPKCLAPMKGTAVPMGGLSFRVDVCRPCELLWFDRGQLDLAQILYEKEQDSLTPEERLDIGGAALVRLPKPEVKEKPLDVYLVNSPPTLKNFDDPGGDLGMAGTILRILVGSRVNDYYSGPPWWP